jgi:hypothetical protein
MSYGRKPSADIECFNDRIFHIDLDDLEVETLDQRIELSLAVLFGELGNGDGGESQSGCSPYHSCEPNTRF